MAKGSEGNLCLFLLVRITCILLFAIGVGVLADGVYATIQSRSFDYYAGGVMVFGAVIVLLSTLGYLNRSSPWLLLVYLSVLFLVFLALTGLTIAMILDAALADKVGGETHANYLRYSLLFAAIVALLAVLLACCYRSSLLVAVYKDRKDNADKELGKAALIEGREEQPVGWRERRRRKADKAMENVVSAAPDYTQKPVEGDKTGEMGKSPDAGKKPMITPVFSAQKPRSSNPFPS